jgi:hypothetical protein
VIPNSLLVLLDWLASPDGIGWLIAYASALALWLSARVIVRTGHGLARAGLMFAIVLALPLSLLGLALALNALPRILDRSGVFAGGDVVAFLAYSGTVLIFLLGAALAGLVKALRTQLPIPGAPPHGRPSVSSPRPSPVTPVEVDGLPAGYIALTRTG